MPTNITLCRKVISSESEPRIALGDLIMPQHLPRPLHCPTHPGTFEPSPGSPLWRVEMCPAYPKTAIFIHWSRKLVSPWVGKKHLTDTARRGSLLTRPCLSVLVKRKSSRRTHDLQALQQSFECCLASESSGATEPPAYSCSVAYEA